MTDTAYAEALRKRVSDPIRWEAFLTGKPEYEGQDCPRCGSTRRRTRDRSCYACKLKANAENFQRIRSGVAPVAGRSLAGHLDMLHRRKRERAGDFSEFKGGDWTARQYPSGKLTVACTAAVIRVPGLRPLPASPYIHAAPFGCCPDALPFNCADLNAVPPELVHGLAERNADFMDLLRWASWA